MLKRLTNLFKDDKCECRGCMVTRCGCGYAPCSKVKVLDFKSQPPRKR